VRDDECLLAHFLRETYVRRNSTDGVVGSRPTGTVRTVPYMQLLLPAPILQCQ
jgi:hypothetical protein